MKKPMQKNIAPYGCNRFMSYLAIGFACLSTAGCSTGPRSLEANRLIYNEAIKSTSEAQLLLNIVRLRYNDTPSSLAVSAVATQSEVQKSFQLAPFFGVSGGDPARHFAALLPQAQISTTDRPTITLTPLDDQEFTRKLFTPMTLDGVLYLTKTTWPISTVFRLWLENLNWVSNAQNASGPTLKSLPDYTEFLRGINALQALQDRGHIVFSTEEREELRGIKAAGPTPHDLLDAAKEGYEFHLDNNSALALVKKIRQPVMRIHPEALASPEMRELAYVFGLRPGLSKYDLKIENLDPFKINHPSDGVDVLDLETRSLLQVLYFVSKGLDVPVEHMERGFVQATTDKTGRQFDWRKITSNLFHVHSASGDSRPPGAHVAVKYMDYWFYIDKADQDTMATFSLLMQLARLETNTKTGLGPALTLPLSGR